MTRPLIALALICAFPCAVRADEPDAGTTQAKADLDAIEGDLNSMAAGDTEGANALVKRINAVRDLLGKSTKDKRLVPLWKECAARCTSIDKAVRSRASAKGGEFAAASALGTDDRRVFTAEFEPVYVDYSGQVTATDGRVLASEWRVKRFADAIARMRASLAKIKDQDNAAVKTAATRVGELEAAWKKKVETGRAQLDKEAADAEAAAQDVDTRLAEIEKFFDPRSFRCTVESPFTEERVRGWIARLREVQRLQKKGLAMLEKILQDHPEHDKNPRLKRLQGVFATELERQLQSEIERVTRTMQGEVHAAKFLLQPDFITEERLSNDPWVTDALTKARNAADASRSIALFAKEWNASEDTASVTQSEEFAKVADKMEQGAVKAMANTRMPAVRSTDETLLATAKETLANPKIGAGEIRRMIINAALASREEKRSEARDEGEFIRVWTWTEAWDQFQVCCAEKSGGDWRLVYYTMKYVTRGPKWMTREKWYVSDRIVGRRIAEENIEK